MKVVQVIDTLSISFGGPARNSFELNISLNQLEDVEARLFYLRGSRTASVLNGYDGAAGPLPDNPPARIRPLRSNGEASLVETFMAVRKADVLVIHQYYRWWILPAIVIAKVLKTAVVITPHGSLTRHQQRFSRKKKVLFELLLGKHIRRLIAGWVTGSDSEKSDLQNTYPGKIVEVAGVGTTMPANVELESPWHSPLRLLTLSRIAPKKRHDLAIGALRVLAERGFDAELEIVGDGPKDLVKTLRAQVASLGLEDFVHFRGQQMGAAKDRTFRNADIYLLPSDDENFGISLAEAVAYGLPTVVSSGVASAKFLRADAGHVLDQPTAISIAEAIADLAGRDRKVLSASARACAEDHFSWDAAARRWVDALSRMVKNDGAGFSVNRSHTTSASR